MQRAQWLSVGRMEGSGSHWWHVTGLKSSILLNYVWMNWHSNEAQLTTSLTDGEMRLVKPCRRKVRLSQKSARRFLRQSHFSATVSLFCYSVDRALRVWCSRFMEQLYNDLYNLLYCESSSLALAFWGKKNGTSIPAVLHSIVFHKPRSVINSFKTREKVLLFRGSKKRFTQEKSRLWHGVRVCLVLSWSEQT